MHRLAAAALVLTGTAARADTPRSIGRAGVGTASDDGGGALLVNPAGLARRDSTRAQVGVAVVDDAMEWRPDDPSAPIANDQSASALVPQVALETELGDGWIVGLGAQTRSISTRTFASPTDYPVNMPDDVIGRVQYRYAGIAGALRRDVFSAGVAHRLGEDVAVGVSVGAERTALDETRSIWASSVPGRAIDDRSQDIAIALSATGFSPTAAAGVLVAPSDSRVEVAASLAYTGRTSLSGRYSTADPNPGSVPPGVAALYQAPAATIDLHQPLTARAAARWVGEHWIGELDADVLFYSDAAHAASWQLTGLTVTDTANGAIAPVARVPSRVSAQTHGAVRAALDIELLAGFLWATTGYAYTSAGTAPDHLSPTFGELATHTGALGLEISAGDFTIAVGWARTWSAARASQAPAPVWQHDDPFPIDQPALPAGRYRSSRDLVGISVDASL